MSFTKIVGCLLIVLLMGMADVNRVGGSVFTEKDSSFIYMADPTIFYDNGMYYLYGTYDLNSKDGVKVYWAKDLYSFSESNSSVALKKGEAYGTKDFWAPQIWKEGGKYYMAYVADEHIAMASSTNPKGPFVGDDKPLIDYKKTIDPFVFKDDDGKRYLLHVEFSDGNKIYVARLKEYLSGIYPETDSLCLSAQDTWEKKMDNVVEGPTVLKRNGWYYLIYSANHFKSKYYAVGYAVSKSIYGPWTKCQDNPVLSIEGTGISGTGHGDIFQDKNGQLFYVFHTHNSDSTITPRKTAFTKIYFKSGAKNIPDSLYIDEKNIQFLRAIP